MKQGGAGALLYPPGITSILDVPVDLAIAIEHAHRVSNWQENLQKDEMPPKWMWHLEWELEEWFEDVERRREERYGGGGDETPDDSQMMGNALAERFKR